MVLGSNLNKLREVFTPPLELPFPNGVALVLNTIAQPYEGTINPCINLQETYLLSLQQVVQRFRVFLPEALAPWQY